jgi:hypothetical protein
LSGKSTLDIRLLELSLVVAEDVDSADRLALRCDLNEQNRDDGEKSEAFHIIDPLSDWYM